MTREQIKLVFTMFSSYQTNLSAITSSIHEPIVFCLVFPIIETKREYVVKNKYYKNLRECIVLQEIETERICVSK